MPENDATIARISFLPYQYHDRIYFIVQLEYAYLYLASSLSLSLPL